MVQIEGVQCYQFDKKIMTPVKMVFIVHVMTKLGRMVSWFGKISDSFVELIYRVVEM